MARLNACFAIFVVYCSADFAFGAPDGAKANDVLEIGLQEQSVKAVFKGSNIVEALKEVANRLEKRISDPTTMTCPECPKTHANVTCPICPKPQCPDRPDNGNNLQNQANITCPECPGGVTAISCPEPVKCPACPKLTECSDELTSLPVDCYEYRKRGFVKSGIYKIHPFHYSIEGPVEVYCDMETDGGGWTVFQRRGDFVKPKQDFYLNWADYKKGFGDLKREFWLGNDYLFALTNQKRVSLRIDLQDWEREKRYATYEDFLVRSEEDNYRVTFRNYAGNAGDSFNDNNDASFSTKDRDKDKWGGNCAQLWTAGWWFNKCTKANLNGVYLLGKYTSDEKKRGLIWYHWKGEWYSLKWIEMKFRPLLASN